MIKKEHITKQIMILDKMQVDEEELIDDEDLGYDNADFIEDN